ncbi:MAG: VCBS repeat-containing protein, partial [Bacteroidota bacterium]
LISYHEGSELAVSKLDDEGHRLFRTVAMESLGVDFVHQENRYDDYQDEPLLPYETSKLGTGVAVADVNGDGLEDFYIGGASGQSGMMYLQTVEGYFESSNDALWEADKQFEDMGSLFFDFDSDGDQDLYVVSGGNEKDKSTVLFQDRLYRNNGKGRFVKTSSALPVIVASGSRVVSGDYDGDGDQDLFVGGRLVAGQYPWPARSYLLRNDRGVFKDVTETIAPDFASLGMITDAEWTDFDANGTLDLIIVGEWTPLLFYSNVGERFVNVTASTGLEDTNGWWSSVVQGDFDNDGDVDYVVGNLGLNYKYQASPAEPFEVFADDFDGNGRKDIVLSYYNFGKLFPVRGRSCSSAQIPSLKKKFKDYNSFSIAEVSEVYGTDKLASAAIHYKAHTFASSYVENLGNGRFALRKLPNEAQFSSVNQIVSKDIDGDGFLDLVTAGNLYTAEIETPRNDSSIGTYLQGDGKGNFAVVANKQCGLHLPGDVKDMAAIKIGAHTFLLAAKNDAQPQMIRLGDDDRDLTAVR